MKPVHVDSNKQIQGDMDTIVSFVIQNGSVSEVGAISVLGHVNCKLFLKKDC